MQSASGYVVWLSEEEQAQAFRAFTADGASFVFKKWTSCCSDMSEKLTQHGKCIGHLLKTTMAVATLASKLLQPVLNLNRVPTVRACGARQKASCESNVALTQPQTVSNQK